MGELKKKTGADRRATTSPQVPGSPAEATPNVNLHPAAIDGFHTAYFPLTSSFSGYELGLSPSPAYPYNFDYNAPNVPGPGPMQVGLYQNQAGNICTTDVENHANLRDAYFTGSAMATQIGNSGATVLDAACRQGGLSHTQFGEPDQIIATPTNPGDFSFISGCRRLEAPLG